MKYLCFALFLCVSFLHLAESDDDCNITVEMIKKFWDTLTEMKDNGEITDVCTKHVITERDPEKVKEIMAELEEEIKHMDEEQLKEIRDCLSAAFNTAARKVDEGMSPDCIDKLVKNL